MDHGSNLGKASGYFFFSGFVFSKIPFLPINIFALALNIISVSSYLIGYLLWYVGTYLHPEHIRNEQKWFGFAQFREQFRIAAFLGATATVLSLIALFIPIIIIPAVWVILISNIVWAIGEYHKWNNPPLTDPTYSSSQQKSFLIYTLAMMFMALTAAIAATVLFFQPIVSVPVFIFSSLLGLGIAAFAAEYWLDYTFGTHQPDAIKCSYNQMSHHLGSGIAVAPRTEVRPHAHNELFKGASANESELQPDAFSSCNSPT